MKTTLSSFRKRGVSLDKTKELIERKQLRSIFIGEKYEVKVYRFTDYFIFKLYAQREYKDEVRLSLGEVEDIIRYGLDDEENY